jgi:hypothetical protein
MYIPNLEVLKSLIASLRRTPSSPDMPSGRGRGRGGFPKTKEPKFPKDWKIFY